MLISLAKAKAIADAIPEAKVPILSFYSCLPMVDFGVDP